MQIDNGHARPFEVPHVPGGDFCAAGASDAADQRISYLDRMSHLSAICGEQRGFAGGLLIDFIKASKKAAAAGASRRTTRQ